MSRRCLLLPNISSILLKPPTSSSARFYKNLHTSPATLATLLPITAHGPPPRAPEPTVSEIALLRRRQRVYSELQRVKEEEAAAAATTTTNTAAGSGMWRGKRVWKNVNVVETAEGYEIHLDIRPLRSPLSKSPIKIPLSKPLLASAIALEWSLLRTTADAGKSHLTPLTQLSSRVLDLTGEERVEIVNCLMRYLDTDTLLCWAPTSTDVGGGEVGGRGKARSLRELQIDAARPIIAWLSTYLWPGIVLKTLDGDHGILPVTKQSNVTKEIIKTWLEQLPPWELVAAERAVLATKSLLIGARLITEWSSRVEKMGGENNRVKGFGVEEAAQAASVEVEWQTGRWGVVEDTHDVDRVDLRRRLGAGVLLVCETEA